MTRLRHGTNCARDGTTCGGTIAPDLRPVGHAELEGHGCRGYVNQLGRERGGERRSDGQADGDDTV